MDSKKMFLSFVPWVAFSVLSARHGADGAAAACLVAAGLSLVFAIMGSKNSSVKMIDVLGIVLFGAMAVVAAVGDVHTENRIIDFGRGGAALVLGAVMLISTLFVPFTEQYARDTVDRQYWHSPVFRSVNRRISAVWGVAVLAMGVGHLLAGAIDPASAPHAGARPVDLILNWGLPVLLVLWAVKVTEKLAADAGKDRAATDTAPVAR
jgi:hypothetical protein